MTEPRAPSASLSPSHTLVARLFGPSGELAAGVSAGVLLGIGVASGQAGRPLVWLSLAIGLVYGGRAAVRALRVLSVNIDVLMVAGAAVAAAIGHPAEGALLLVLFTLSGALEALAMERTRSEVKALHGLMPREAVVWQGGAWTVCLPESLAPGERIKVRVGEVVPADALVVDGHTEIDQATLTGESIPRTVGPGDEVYAGTINTANPVECRILRAAADSSLQKILNLVTQAQQQREPVQRMIDRLSQPYAVGVFVVAAGVMVIWAALLGFPPREAAYTAITLLIVASPCALVIATPTATLAAISRGARAGILFKGGQAIERLAGLGAVCFDKTGTLTVGRPRLEHIALLGAGEEEEALAIAAGLEEGSTHPLATAILDAARARGLPVADVAGATNTAGRGMTGRYAGREVRLGSLTHAEPMLPAASARAAREVLGRIRSRGELGAVLAWTPHGGAEVLGAVLVMTDRLRPGAHELVDQLHGLGVRPVRMLTGDNPLTARTVAESLGIDRWDAELLPQDKVAAVRLQRREIAARRRWKSVGVIGDGVNDAPALAAADVSIAIGSIGSDAALESADIVLLSDDLATVPWAVRLARRARRTIQVNLGIALGIIGLMGIATLVGSLLGRPVPLSLGVLAHEGGTVAVVLNSLRLLAAAPPAAAPREPVPEAPALVQAAPAASPACTTGRC